jgi:drug/metabolite transporter (DMT)-like permease
LASGNGWRGGRDVTQSAVIPASLAVITAALAWAIAREPVTHVQGLGIGVALTGVLCLSGAA